MAKKEKIALTPEERQAREERKKEKRKIFGETFTKSVALFLAVVFVYAAAYVAFGQGSTIYETVPFTPVVNNNAAGNAGSVVVPGGTPSAGDTQSGNAGDAAAPQSDEAAEAAKAINEATAKAASGVGYDWARNCQFTKSVDVGSATNVLNKVIATVDKNASIDSVVGGFIGVGDNKVTIPKGQEFKDVWGYHASNYKLKATQLKPEDLQNLKVDGDTYTFTLADADTPKKDNSTPINRLTDDIVVQEEVAKEINDMVGSLVSVNNLVGIYTNIKVEVVITDGQLQKLSYSYDAEVKELALKAMGVGVKGTGAMHADATYSNFVY